MKQNEEYDKKIKEKSFKNMVDTMKEFRNKE